MSNDSGDSVRRLKASAWHRWRTASGLAGLLAVGSVFAVGFASPNAVNWPVIGPVFNLLRSSSFSPPDVQQAALSGLGEKVNQSVSDHGITLKIGNVYCDQNQLEFDMVESSVTGGTVEQVFTPSDQNMTISINGTSTLMNISGGNFRRTQSGSYAGIVYDNAFNQSTYQPFPANFQLNVHINQVGTQSGNWNFTIPISRSRVLAATKIYTLGKSVSSGGHTITIQKVIVGPGQTLVDYQVSDPTVQSGGAVGISDLSQITVLNGDTGEQLRPGGGGGPVDAARTTEDTTVQMFQQVFMTPNPLPENLTIKVGTGHASTVIPVSLR